MNQEQIVYKKYEFFNSLIKNQNLVDGLPIIDNQLLDIIYYFNTFKEILTLACCEGHIIDESDIPYPYILFAVSDEIKIGDMINQIMLPISNLPKIDDCVVHIYGTNRIEYTIYWNGLGLISSNFQDIKNILRLSSLTFDDEFAKTFYKKIKLLIK